MVFRPSLPPNHSKTTRILALRLAATLELAFAGTGESGVGGGVLDAVLRIGLGAGAGLAGGRALDALLRRHGLVPDGLENVLTLAAAITLFEGCNAVLSDSGLLAVVVAGVTFGNTEAHRTRAVQSAPQTWHAEEDAALHDYARTSARLNVLGVVLDVYGRLWLA